MKYILSCLMSIYLEEVVEESVQLIYVRVDGIGQPVQPDSGWRGNGKVLHLKHDCHHLGRDKDIM